MQGSESFWDKAAEKYARRPIKDMAAYEKTMERTRAHLPEDGTVLELGCGTGSTALLLSSSVQHITGSDISANMIAIARAKAEAQGVANVDFVQADAQGNTPATGPFDAVLAFNLLHLLENPQAAIGGARGLLKPGGLFISKTVCLGDKGLWLRVLITVMKAVGLAPYVRFMGVGELEAMIAAQGFEIIETGTYPASPPSRFIVARRTEE